ncbi:ABC transporter permease [Nonomuraea muscovyensis]|uniref:ABC-2 type transport system permease protein n=1 Tax=Nonomuraea muscovyensis TaxID=1124761 RepID=A0A7X0C5T0_9ACTN|nr:ABC transporter permease [Nonomuraea muscovyensis]MBB6347636.1 ABC-2 type transport system permease protein [Nonomuraea muscovyensis]
MSALTGAGTIARLIVRRDRLILPVWGLAAAVFPMSIAGSTAALYPTAESLRSVARGAMDNPTQLATRGPVFDASVGGLTAWTVGSSGAMLLGLVSMLLVIRHTRVEEESGRRELLGAGVVGRHAPLAAALGVVLAADLLIALLMSAALMSGGLPATGSIALGLSLAAAGWTFAAVGAVVAQVTESAVAARGLGLAVFVVCFLVRAVGDAGGAHGLSWLSPLGWTLHLRPFAGERWWVLAPLLALVALLATAAHLLSARRDLAAGLLPPRLGPATAGPGLRSPLALAWRLHRGQLVAWSAGFAVGGLALGGAVSGGLEGQIDAPQIMDMIAKVGGEHAGPADFFLNYLLSMLAWIVAAYGIVSALRLRSEESAGRADLVLVTPVSRARWALSHLVIAAAGPAVVLAALGAATGLGYGLSAGDLGRLPQVLGAALAYLPAVWAMTGIAAALAGLLPRLASASWGVWTAFILLDVFGTLGQVDETLLTIIPFVHVPWVVLGQTSTAPLAVLTAVAAALTALGIVGLRRRDLT